MNLNDFNAYHQSEKFVKSIVKTSKQLNNLETGALVATTAGLIGLALIVHVVFTVFALMSGGLLIYRYLAFRQERQDIVEQSRFQRYDDILERKKDLFESNLPEDEKKQISAHLDYLYLDDVEKKQLVERIEPKKLVP